MHVLISLGCHAREGRRGSLLRSVQVGARRQKKSDLQCVFSGRCLAQVNVKTSNFFCLGHAKHADYFCLRARPEQTFRVEWRGRVGAG